ncbi:MAG: hypothetical protein V7703_21775, partial [Hyphomicrobiales bacterium]
MTIRYLNNADPTTWSDADIENQGGWRVHMRAPTTHGLGNVAKEAAQIRKFPRAALATAFILAKMGNPIGARELLDFLQSVIAEDTQADALLESDFSLVD